MKEKYVYLERVVCISVRNLISLASQQFEIQEKVISPVNTTVEQNYPTFAQSYFFYSRSNSQVSFFAYNVMELMLGIKN